MHNLIVCTPVLGAAGLLLALFVAVGIKRLPPGTTAMQECLSYIENITGAFIKKHYIVAAGLTLAVFFIILFLFNLSAAISFLGGVLASILLLNRLMDIIGKAGTRAAAAGNSSDKALAVMLCGAFVAVVLVMALILLGSGLLLAAGNLKTISFFLLGISMVALLYSTGSSIFGSAITTTETSWLLPSSIAIDLFESGAVALAGAMTIGALGIVHFGFAGILLPLLIFSAGLIGCILALIIIIIHRQQGLGKIMGKAIIFYTLFLIIFSLIIVRYLLHGEQLKVFLTIVPGLGLALLMFLPLGFSIPSIFKQDDSNDLRIRYYLAICIPVLLLALLLSYYSAGFYGVSITSLAFLLFTGIAVFICYFTQIKILAADLTVRVRDKNDDPDIDDDAYKEIAASSDIGEGIINHFAIVSMAFAVFVLLLVFIQVARVQKTGIINDGLVLLGLVIGLALPYLFTSWVNNSVRVPQDADDNGGYDDQDDKLEGETVKQHHEVTKDYGYYACWESLLVFLAAAAITLLTGFLLGKQVLAALLVGAGIAGILMAVIRAKNYEPHLSILIKFLFILSLAIAAPLL